MKLVLIVVSALLAAVAAQDWTDQLPKPPKQMEDCYKDHSKCPGAGQLPSFPGSENLPSMPNYPEMPKLPEIPQMPSYPGSGSSSGGSKPGSK